MKNMNQVIQRRILSSFLVVMIICGITPCSFALDVVTKYSEKSIDQLENSAGTAILQTFLEPVTIEFYGEISLEEKILENDQFTVIVEDTIDSSKNIEKKVDKSGFFSFSISFPEDVYQHHYKIREKVTNTNFSSLEADDHVYEIYVSVQPDGTYFVYDVNNLKVMTKNDKDQYGPFNFTNKIKTKSNTNVDIHTDDIVNILPFTDVPVHEWYYGDVLKAYQMELINGRDRTTFAPEANMTYAEAVKLASCMNQKYLDGTVTLTNGNPWYQTYVDYAKSHNIISRDYSWDSKVTRAGYAEIFAHALPSSQLAAQNSIPNDSIPDVKINHNQAVEIYRLYRAGIITGVDDAGTFRPNSYIKRSEVAAILTRMMDKNSRKSFTLETIVTPTPMPVPTPTPTPIPTPTPTPTPVPTPEPTPTYKQPVYKFLIEYIQKYGNHRSRTYMLNYETSVTDSGTMRYSLTYNAVDESIDLIMVDSKYSSCGLELTSDLSGRYVGVLIVDNKSTEFRIDAKSFNLDTTPTIVSGYGGYNEQKMYAAGLSLNLLQLEKNILVPNGYSLKELGFDSMP